MAIIRIPREQWGKVWHFLVETGPISRISEELIYAISERQLRLLRKKKLPFELMPLPNGAGGKKHG